MDFRLQKNRCLVIKHISRLRGLLDIYEIKESERGQVAKFLTRIFNYRPADDIRTIEDGEVIDLGRNKVHCIHTPGHTPGHIVLLFEPDDVLFVADLDLTKFGPYYGDSNSSLEDTIRSIEKIRSLASDLRACISFHQAGSRGTFRLCLYPQACRRRCVVSHPEYLSDLGNWVPSWAGGRVIAEQIWGIMQNNCIAQRPID